MKKCITSLLILMSVNTFAQSRCAVAEIDSIRSLNNPSFNFKKALINKEISKNVISDRLASSAISGTVIKIPVVVHVLTDRNPEDIGGLNNNNISEEQILSQIKVLNQDYRRQAGTNGFNTNPVGVDMEIEFLWPRLTQMVIQPMVLPEQKSLSQLLILPENTSK
ncbi:hypothetical protein ACFFJX_08435 [Pseudarcicella hirudinis]|uniref:hypothetical protein n=1 Tax=Pseudarcicella hirudinis TaxID=1079859 RepID=UPI0035EAE5FC